MVAYSIFVWFVWKQWVPVWERKNPQVKVDKGAFSKKDYPRAKLGDWGVFWVEAMDASQKRLELDPDILEFRIEKWSFRSYTAKELKKRQAEGKGSEKYE